MPATEKGLRDRTERNRMIYSALKTHRGRSIWKQLMSLTGLTKPRLGRGLRELERYDVLKRIWMHSLDCWMYELTGQELSPIEPFYKRSYTKRVYKDYTGGMKTAPVRVNRTRTRVLRWRIPTD